MPQGIQTHVPTIISTANDLEEECFYKFGLLMLEGSRIGSLLIAELKRAQFSPIALATSAHIFDGFDFSFNF